MHESEGTKEEFGMIKSEETKGEEEAEMIDPGAQILTFLAPDT
jgi:hypothetical protein